MYPLNQGPNQLPYNNLPIDAIQRRVDKEDIHREICIIHSKIKDFENKAFSSPLPKEELLKVQKATDLLKSKVAFYNFDNNYITFVENLPFRVQTLIDISFVPEENLRGCKRKREGDEQLPNAKKIKTPETVNLGLIQSSQSNYFLPLDIIPFITSHLSAKDILLLALTNKKNLSLLFHETIANKICLDPKVCIIDFSSFAGSSLSKLNLVGRHWTDRVFIQIFQNCPNLTKLDLTHCEYITHASIKVLTENCTNLQRLRFDLNDKISGSGIQAISQIYTNLTDLSFIDEKDDPDDRMGSCKRTKIFENCTKLKRFSDYQLDHKETEVLATHCTNLEKLFLKDSDINQETLVKLFENCTNLKVLDLTESTKNMTNANLALLSKKCTKIKEIYLRGNYLLTDDAICSFLQNSTHLISLKLSVMSSLSDRSALAIAEYCSNLSYLDLSCNEKLTDTAIIEIAKKCTKLTYLDINGNKEITNDAIVEIAKKCTQLTYLNLDGDYKITDNAIIEIAKKCTQLTYLDIQGIEGITSIALAHIAKGCTKLTHLDISEIGETADKPIIETILKSCPDLRNLYTSFDNHDAEYKLTTFVHQQFPRVTIEGYIPD